MPPEGHMPPEPMTDLVEAAVNMHVFYEAYISAGFSAQQALYLTGQMLREMVSNANGGSPDA